METKVTLLAYINILSGFEEDVKEATIKLNVDSRTYKLSSAGKS